MQESVEYLIATARGHSDPSCVLYASVFVEYTHTYMLYLNNFIT